MDLCSTFDIESALQLPGMRSLGSGKSTQSGISNSAPYPTYGAAYRSNDPLQLRRDYCRARHSQLQSRLDHFLCELAEERCIKFVRLLRPQAELEFFEHSRQFFAINQFDWRSAVSNSLLACF